MGLGRLVNTYLLVPCGLSVVRTSALRQAETEKAKLRSAVASAQTLDRRVDDLAKMNADLAARLTGVQRTLTRLSRRVLISAADQELFLALARRFSPRTATGHRKVRVGRPHDGGYVMLDDFVGIAAAFSFGVGNDSAWDIQIAERGIPTYQFDHTIASAPASHPKLQFFRRKIVSTPQEDGATIAELLDLYGADRDAEYLLKIDIEGDEWPLFADAEPHHLRRFRQIVCEFHEFDRAGSAAWYIRAMRALEKLSVDFEVVHVHANNAVPYAVVGNVPFPRLLEVTFANRARYQFTECSDTFPTPIDQPNIAGTADLFLGRFQF